MNNRMLQLHLSVLFLLFGVTWVIAGEKTVTKPLPAEPSHFTTFMRNSGWCWYQDPRAIIHKDMLVVGGVEGNGRGAAVIGVYDLKEERILGRTVVNESFDRDDHNSPVFWLRPDNSLLAVYTRHGRDKLHRYRISDTTNYLKWGAEKVFRHAYPKAGNATYMNLYAMRDEGKLYNFFRGIHWNPSFMTSKDNGESWGEPTHFIASSFRGRPYARYIGNGKDTVHVSFTDAHPRDFGNSLYYAAFRGGAFYRANGDRIKVLAEDGPLRPNEAERVFHGGGGKGRGGSLSALKAGWNSSIAIDRNGNPHLANTLYISNTDHRYRIASWDGKAWHEREVAYAGSCLYDRESSYTGLITLDPVDPTYVVISTDVDPTTGKQLRGPHEIYWARVGSADTIKSITWKPVTRNTPKGLRNIRPVILRYGNKRLMLWQRGTYNTFVDYNLDTVGIIQTVNSQ